MQRQLLNLSIVHIPPTADHARPNAPIHSVILHTKASFRGKQSGVVVILFLLVNSPRSILLDMLVL